MEHEYKAREVKLPPTKQTITAPTSEDLARIEEQRDWVRGHYTPEAQHKYETMENKLVLLQTILDNGWIEKSETWKLQSLGITLGDALAQELGMEWVMVEDEYGRDPALRLSGTTIVLFPLTMISKRIERGEEVIVTELFDVLCDSVRDTVRRVKNDLESQQH
ncbi:MAG: DUF3806 domain-containing protein [Zoogloeaceae bacterium]|jgi:hypothetical protein|nr:DUF3806 domain-containing protein [Zoogloeaceae bacterium]